MAIEGDHRGLRAELPSPAPQLLDDVDVAAMDAVEETDRRHPRDVGAAVAARRIEIEIALHVESRRRREDHAPGGRGVCLVFVETRMPEPALERDPNAP